VVKKRRRKTVNVPTSAAGTSPARSSQKIVLKKKKNRHSWAVVNKVDNNNEGETETDEQESKPLLGPVEARKRVGKLRSSEVSRGEIGPVQPDRPNVYGAIPGESRELE
jgi:hypothetical protein